MQEFFGNPGGVDLDALAEGVGIHLPALDLGEGGLPLPGHLDIGDALVLHYLIHGKPLVGRYEACLLYTSRTLQRYRQKHIIPYSMIGRQIRYPRQAVESLRERWMVETPAAKIDQMIAEHPLHNRKNGSYGKKGRDTGKNQ